MDRLILRADECFDIHVDGFGNLVIESENIKVYDEIDGEEYPRVRIDLTPEEWKECERKGNEEVNKIIREGKLSEKEIAVLEKMPWFKRLE